MRVGTDAIRSTVSGSMKAVGGAMRQRSPRFDEAVRTGWRLYQRIHFTLVAKLVVWKTRNGASIDPYEIFWIDPARIEYMSKPLSKRRFRYAGSPIKGEWDRLDTRFVETEIYRFIHARFGRGLDWHDIDLFDEFVRRIERGERLWDCTTEAAFERRCRELDQLYESLERHGFKTQAELADTSQNHPFGAGRLSKRDRFIEDEMAITIGRDGDLLACEGCDRLAMAKLLGVEAVPVRVLVRHSEWQCFRNRLVDDEVGTQKLSPTLQSHPDLQNIVESKQT